MNGGRGSIWLIWWHIQFCHPDNFSRDKLSRPNEIFMATSRLNFPFKSTNRDNYVDLSR